MHIFNITIDDRINLNLQNMEMGIVDAKVEGHANAYAVNDNKITISQEIVMILLLIFVIIAVWKFLKNYIKNKLLQIMHRINKKI